MRSLGDYQCFGKYFEKKTNNVSESFDFSIKKMRTFATIFVGFEGMEIDHGEMSEWFKEHAWKVCILQKGIAGSNPALSANN